MMKVGTSWKGFTVGHRVPWHEKCGRIHGHNLRVRVEVEGGVDASTGMIVDFGVLGKALADIVEPWDHKFLADRSAVLIEGGPLDCIGGGKYTETISFEKSYVIDRKYVLPEGDVVVLPMNLVTSENLAGYILQLLISQQWAQQKTVRVQISENGENIAEASMFVSTSTATTTFRWDSNWTTYLGFSSTATAPTNYVTTYEFPP